LSLTSKRASGEYSDGPADYRLPASMTREIGRIVVRWAYFEWYLQTIIWRLTGVDERIGRLAIKDPRITERLALLRDLAALRGIVLNERVYSELQRTTRIAAERRDMAAHGVWRRSTDDWAVQWTRGTYPQGHSDKHDSSRKIAPEAFHADPTALRSVSDAIEKLIEGIRAIDKELPDELPPLRDKRAQRSSRQGRVARADALADTTEATSSRRAARSRPGPPDQVSGPLSSTSERSSRCRTILV
jgi:hypothetical protein